MPSPSMTSASAGTGTLSPTASINPFRTTTVPFAITGPLTVTIFAFRIAMDVGAGWANAVSPQTTSAASKCFMAAIAYYKGSSNDMAQKKRVGYPVGYKDAGVNIDEADRAVDRIRKMARSTFTPGVLTDIGSFGGAFRLKGFRDPVLISSADGVGTKLKLAFSTGRHSTIGEDLVNHCVNDIAVQGAAPLFFLDYFATGKLDAAVAAEVISGIARGCRANKCALIGGETAEMPGFYPDNEYDLAGFIVGAVERKRMITGRSIRKGDVLLGLPSNGLHTNGYSLARKLLPNADRATTEELLQLHRSYLKPIQKLHEADLLKGAAHITCGGITENTPRILPKGSASGSR